MYRSFARSLLDYEIKNTLDGLKKLSSKLKKLYKKEYDNLVFVYEPTGSYSEMLKKFCAKQSIKIFAINPKRSHNFAKANGNRNKTDIDDAKVLSEAIVLAKEDEIVRFIRSRTGSARWLISITDIPVFR